MDIFFSEKEIPMSNIIITVANQKGGCGKTTVTMNLAGFFGKMGKKVCVVDADPQGTSSIWASNADDAKPFPAFVMGLSSKEIRLKTAVKQITDQNIYDVILIDCPPAVDSPIPKSAMLFSDFCLFPTIPSGPDIAATQRILEEFKDAKYDNELLEGMIVPSIAETGNTLIKDICMEGFAQFNMPISKAIIHGRTAYKQSFLAGCSVFGLSGQSKASACAEMRILGLEVQGIIDNILRGVEA